MFNKLLERAENPDLSDRHFREYVKRAIPAYKRELDRLENLSYNERYEAKIKALEEICTNYGWEESVRNGHK